MIFEKVISVKFIIKIKLIFNSCSTSDIFVICEGKLVLPHPRVYEQLHDVCKNFWEKKYGNEYHQIWLKTTINVANIERLIFFEWKVNKVLFVWSGVVNVLLLFCVWYLI